MIAELRISLLGEIRLEKNGEALRGLPSRAAQALLIYLACTPRAVPREKLAEMLWAERSSRQALTNLRTILAPLRREAGDFLLITRQTLAFNRESAYWLDAEAFETRLRDFLGQSDPLDAGRAAELEEILALYRGDFLDGFYLRDGRGFDEWTSVQRERLRLLAYEGFRALATWQLEAGQYRRGVETASRWMRLSPYDEHACRTLMWLLTRSGQRNLALRHYQQMQHTLAADLGVVPAPASQDLYAYLRSVEFPPPNNLPPPASSFIGRAGEVASLVETLRATFPRLVTLSGAGGIGKTRLALETARRLARRWPGRFLDGIFFVPLEGAPSAAAAAARVAEAASLRLEGAESIRDGLVNALREREMLLILDNFERLLTPQGGGAGLAAALLKGAPRVKLLVTSRQRLNLYEETVFALSGLSLPDEASPPEEADATRLFLQAARKTGGELALRPEELACVGRACRLVDGIPLAIELAAGWARHHSPCEIAEHIAHDLDFLQSEYRDLPQRHRSLRAVFTHSWTLLSPAERDALARFALFRNGFTLEAAESLLKGAAEALLRSLEEKSLLQRQPPGRYAIHPLMQTYAAEKLRQNPAVESRSRAAHARFYLGWLSSLGDGETPEQRAAIRKDLENIRAAWTWAVENEAWGLVEASVRVLHGFYSIQSWFLTGIAIFQEAVDALGLPAPEHMALRCDLLSRKARMCIHIGRLEEARSDLRDALAALESISDPTRRSVVLGYLAISHFYAGEYQQAVNLAEESRRLAEQSDDRDGVAFALTFLGSCYKALGRYPQAEQAFQEALALSRVLGNDVGAGMLLNNLGNLAQVQGDYAAAREYYREGSALFATHEHTHGAATLLANAGRLALRQGQPAQACEMLEESLKQKRRIGDRRGMGVSLVALGEARLALGDFPGTREALTEGLQLALESGDRTLTLGALTLAGAYLLQNGNVSWGTALLKYVEAHPALSEETRSQVVSLLPQTAEADVMMPWGESTSPEAVAAWVRVQALG